MDVLRPTCTKRGIFPWLHDRRPLCGCLCRLCRALAPLHGRESYGCIHSPIHLEILSEGLTSVSLSFSPPNPLLSPGESEHTLFASKDSLAESWMQPPHLTSGQPELLSQTLLTRPLSPYILSSRCGVGVRTLRAVISMGWDTPVYRSTVRPGHCQTRSNGVPLKGALLGFWVPICLRHLLEVWLGEN